MNILAVVALLVSRGLFIVDASSEASYTVPVPRSILRAYVDDVQLLSRNMPGVVDITSLGDNRFRYRTEKNLPLARPLVTEFVIRKTMVGDSLAVYRSEAVHDPDYMSCKVKLIPRGEDSTMITISLRVRLSRQNPSDVHWMAPILGEDFISEKMHGDLEEMLREFVERSERELDQGVALPAAAR